MKRLIVALAFLILLLPTRAQERCHDWSIYPDYTSFPGAQPLIMLTEYDAWSMVSGGQRPTLVAYEDGTVIFWKRSGKTGQFLTVRLTPDRLSALLAAFHKQDLEKQNSCYVLSQATDRPMDVFVLRTDSGYRQVAVYALNGFLEEVEKHPDQFPASIVTSYKAMTTFDDANAKPWKPAQLEVVIWPFDYAKGKPTVWPSKWPGIDDPSTVKSKSSYSLFLPISELDAFRKFQSGITEKTAVLIDGKKWVISARYPFPHERP